MRIKKHAIRGSADDTTRLGKGDDGALAQYHVFMMMRLQQ